LVAAQAADDDQARRLGRAPFFARRLGAVAAQASTATTSAPAGRR
jgi:hypothetical protein